MRINISAIQQLNGGDGVAFTSNLSDSYNRQKSINDAITLFDINQHPIKNKPNKTRLERIESVAFNDDGTPIPNYKKSSVELEKNPLDIANYIIDQKTTLVTGAGVGLDSDDTDSELFKKVKLNWDNGKFEYDIAKFYRILKTETQLAIILFGKEGTKEFGYKIASPLHGDTLIPLYNEDTEDFIGLQREYKIGDKDVIDLYYKVGANKPRLKRIEKSVEISDDELPYDNLPIIYFEQKENEIANISELIYAFEDATNTFYDSCKYYSDPILFSKGQMLDAPIHNESGKLFNSLDPQGDLKFVTPENPTEMRKLHFDTLLSLMFMLSRSVRLDSESLKGLGANGLSGEAIERFMTDAYMYATSEQNGEFGKGIQRLVNWLTKEHRSVNKGSSELNIKAKFRKYSLRGEAERVDLFLKANGNLPLIGHEESVIGAGLAKDMTFLTTIKE